jgi:nitrite reductase/ring-hydroxylating ferredoxin subunit
MKNGFLDRRIFADQDIFDLEMDRIFRKTWLALGHESEIPKPNDFFTTWMGADPVIVSRSGDKIKVLLNMCRHRGGTVCRVDRGNAKLFLCPYHGWSYGPDGALKTLPGLEKDYHNEINPAEWGLLEVPRVESYKGLIFATWNADAEPLVEFLGDAAFYLDCLLDRVEGGTELVGGMRRWVIPTNWKHAAENFIGDSYHAATTHSSIMRVKGLEGASGRVKDKTGYQAALQNGHGVGMWVASEENAHGGYGHLAGVNEYLESIEDQLIAKLGRLRGTRLTPVHGTIFPNLSLEFPFASLHIWQPRGPLKTEVRDLTLVDRAMPQEIKDIIRRQCMLRQGPAGTWEQDDMDNWSQTTFSALSPTSRTLLANYQMGLGHEFRRDDIPGLLDNKLSDINQRNMYTRWAELMAVEPNEAPPVAGVRPHVQEAQQ